MRRRHRGDSEIRDSGQPNLDIATLRGWRKKSYGGVHPDKFVDWFLPYTSEFLKILQPDGTFILNIKEKVVDCQRHTYVHDLIRAMRDDQRWLWTEGFIWAKTNSAPGKWPNRFRDAWEHILQFNSCTTFVMNQDAVMVPARASTQKRLSNLSEKDKHKQASQSGSHFTKQLANCVGRDCVYPDNVLRGPTECANRGHPAPFPEWLPEFFIKLFTKPGDIVLRSVRRIGHHGGCCQTARPPLRWDRHLPGIHPARYGKVEQDRFAVTVGERAMTAGVMASADDGAVPAHQAIADREQLEEERRLFYVALTRAKTWLYVTFPLERPTRIRGNGCDLAKVSRFITDDVKNVMTRRGAGNCCGGRDSARRSGTVF